MTENLKELPALHMKDEDKIQESFHNSGCVVIKSAVEVDKINKLSNIAFALIKARLSILGDNEIIADLDDGYQRLTNLDPSYAFDLFRVIRENPAFFDLITSENLQKIYDVIKPGCTPHIAFDNCMIRIDGKEDIGRKFEWHFDNAYISMSDDLVVFWVPLTKVTSDMGRLKIIPGTHRTPWQIKLRNDLANVAFAGPKRVELDGVDFNQLEEQAFEMPDLEPGDIGILHGGVLHRSGDNISSRARWICNPRYGDLFDSAMIERRWKMSRPGNPFVFAEIHPDRVTGGM